MSDSSRRTSNDPTVPAGPDATLPPTSPRTAPETPRSERRWPTVAGYEILGELGRGGKELRTIWKQIDNHCDGKAQ